MAEIVLRHLTKSFRMLNRPAVRDVSLDVADGEFVVLVGPSGCGKTTLLRMVAGLETPDRGTIQIGGRDVTALPARQRGLSMVFQSYAIFPHIRVAENIGFGLKMRGMARPEIASRVAEAAALLQLDEVLDRYPAQLSGGQRQRVAVARAIVVDAAVLLMDEPLSNLDALLRLQFRAELKRIVRKVGATTLYVTHDQAEAMSLADRVAVLHDGQIAQLGDPLTVYDYPSEQFVGGFLGAPPMNFLHATVVDGPHLALGGKLAVPGVPRFLAAYEGMQVLVGVRAEKIEVLSAAGDGGLPAIVEVIEPTGANVLLTVRLADQELKVLAPADSRATSDSEVYLQLPVASLRYFDPETGLALLPAS